MVIFGLLQWYAAAYANFQIPPLSSSHRSWQKTKHSIATGSCEARN